MSDNLVFKIVGLLLGFLFIIYKNFIKGRQFNYKVDSMKIAQFLKFVQNKINLENDIASETAFIHRFNYYIPYSIINYLLKQENPTGLILNYIDGARYLMFENKKIVFKKEYFLSTEKKRKIFFGIRVTSGFIFFIISLFSFIFCLTEFSEEEYDLVTLIISFLYGIVFMYGFILAAKDNVRFKIAMDLVKELEKRK